MAAVTVIKLTGENHRDIDQVAHQIKLICDSGGVRLRGPIPLPTRRLVVPVRRAPDGEGSETYDHYEMRVHKRLIDIVNPNNKTIDSLQRIELPAGVDIEIKIQS